MQGEWSARLTNPHVVTDSGPLLAPLPIEVQGATLQAVIDSWSRQHSIHALTRHGGIVLLQLKRYLFRAGCAVKNREPVLIEPGQLVTLPVFRFNRGTEVEQQQFRVISVVFHLGDNVSSGHYQAALSYCAQSVLLDAAADMSCAPWEYRICDDRRRPRRAKVADHQCINHNAYLIGDGPSIDMAIALQLPKGAYVEMLEEWLLLQAYSGLWREMGHVSLPPALSMAVRNDIIHAAVNALEPELCTVFLDYAEKLQRELPRYAETSFPLPCELPMRPSSAECLAHALLEQGHGSLWTSVRQVAAEISYHTVHRAIGTHLSFSVGAYGHRSFVGLLKQTGTHRSVCRLLNALVTQIYPAHVWTTVTVNVDLKAPTHIDVANASYASLLLGLSHFDDGTLWTEHEAGSSTCAFDVQTSSFQRAKAEYPEVIVISDSEQSEESSDAPVAPAEGDAGENNCTSLKEASDCQAASDGARAADFQIPDSTEHLLCLSEMD
ncbi:hypothetical protein AK812_SmicGene10277 [Symbiodinium microadriaticum]|uniref:Uncharacterized protein n=1 Tax=Symbiodinium microadriaticum TaxID=2951 RepID=A0A1Q9EG75_SYMMI|nr:hypothetical protein AK812_SmicGene10277 [Symbiodinium microadriaticum]